MYLILDTETTGLPVEGLAPNSPNFCRVLQLACLLVDEHFKEVGAYKTLIKLPPHTVVNAGAEKVHGISKQKCEKYGVEVEHALAVFQDFVDKSEMQIAHNLHFDHERLKQEFGLAFQHNDLLLTKPFCTMQAMTPVCKLPGKFGHQYKWPKLREAYSYITKPMRDGTCSYLPIDWHDAMADCKACLEVFKWLKHNNLVPA